MTIYVLILYGKLRFLPVAEQRKHRRRIFRLCLEEQSPRRLLSGLLACALSRREVGDWRDLLVALAPYHHCAQVLQADVAELFDRAGRYTAPAMEEHYRTFGQRRDVTPGAFGQVPRYHTSGLGLLGQTDVS